MLEVRVFSSHSVCASLSSYKTQVAARSKANKTQNKTYKTQKTMICYRFCLLLLLYFPVNFSRTRMHTTAKEDSEEKNIMEPRPW